MIDFLRRGARLHVHDWELIDTRQIQVEQEVRQRVGGVGQCAAVITVPVEIATERCQACGKTRESRVTVG